jgi:thiosulfate dehydrogenase [quinone] large subunit
MAKNMSNELDQSHPAAWAGTLLLPLRLIIGWTYFSAFWRRLVLENKLIPGEPGYVGEKFNHFLPNALLIKPAIKYLLSHPELLWWKLVIFTAVEGIVGVALMLGLMTRAAGLVTSLLAFGILLGAGWLGTTCVDEWQIGVLGIGGGLAFLFAGGGKYSLDYLMRHKTKRLGTWMSWGFSTDLPASAGAEMLAFGSAMAVFVLTLLTNQVFHGGVWGTLHNKSVRPKVEISAARISDGALTVQMERIEGPDVYGSFAIAVRILDGNGAVQAEWPASALAALEPKEIVNAYVAKIEPGKHGLILPLGARSAVTLRHPAIEKLAVGQYRVELIDVSGASWSAPLTVAAGPKAPAEGAAHR